MSSCKYHADPTLRSWSLFRPDCGAALCHGVQNFFRLVHLAELGTVGDGFVGDGEDDRAIFTVEPGDQEF